MTRDNMRVLRAACSVLNGHAARVARGTRHVALAALCAVGLSGCTDWAGYDLDRAWGYIPFLSTMRGTVAYDPHTLPRVPAAGTIPVESPLGEVIPPFTQTQLDSAGAALTNTLASSPEVMARGKDQYDRQCATCHGPAGAGNGGVIGPGKFPYAPPLNAAPANTRSDGYLYAIIRVGRGLMPAYGERLTHLDRWAVVHYVRQLQGRTPSAAPAGAPAPAAAAGGTTPSPVGGSPAAPR